MAMNGSGDEFFARPAFPNDEYSGRRGRYLGNGPVQRLHFRSAADEIGFGANPRPQADILILELLNAKGGRQMTRGHSGDSGEELKMIGVEGSRLGRAVEHTD